MIIFDGPVLPDDLTVFVREVPVPDSLTLDQILPNRYLQTNRVDVGSLTRRGRTARFRAYDAPLHRSRRDQAQLTTVHLPPVSDTLVMGELERLQLEFARTGGTNQRALADAIYNDATNLTQNVQRRMEQARGDVLMDGKFTLAGEGGLFIEADYAIPASNIVTAGVLWTNHTTSDPVADLTAWVYTYRVTAGNGYNPGGMIITFDILQDLLLNQNIRQLAATIIGSPSILTRPMLDAVLAAHGLPPIVQVYDTQVDVDGTSTRVTADNKVVFIPPNPEQNLGYTAWGITATSLELVNSSEADLSFEEAPGIVGVVEKEGPPYRQFTFVDAVGMPVIENPPALFVATVR